MAQEKAPATDQRKGFFAKKRSPKAPGVDVDEKVPNSSATEADPQQVASVSFRQLFRSAKSLGIFWGQCSPSSRYSTTFELCLDAIGLIAAAGAGAAQVRSYFLAARGEALIPLL